MKKCSNQLPEVIKVRVVKDIDGFSAELPDYDVFTCANSEQELQYMLNDLIFELFSIPKKLHKQIVYRKIDQRSNKYLMFATSDIYKNEFSCA